MFDRFNLGQGFSRYFEVLPALDDATRDEVYRIRHSVYCEELGFEPVRRDKRESDAYDRHSLHCMLRTSTAPHRAVGCTRLVLTDPDQRWAQLPFEITCAASIDRSIVDPAKLPRERIAEVSRLAVLAQYRRRRGEQAVPIAINDEDFGTSNQPRFPYVPIGLYLGAVALAARNNIDTLFVLTEPRLAQHFAKFGVRIEQIGSPIEHRGQRIPSMMDVQGIIRNMRFIVKPIWKVIQEEIERGFEAHDHEHRNGNVA